MFRIPRHTIHALIGMLDIVDTARRSAFGAVTSRIEGLVERGRHRANGTANAKPVPRSEPISMPNLDELSKGATAR